MSKSPSAAGSAAASTMGRMRSALLYLLVAGIAVIWLLSWRYLSLDAVRLRLNDLQALAAAKPAMAVGLIGLSGVLVYVAAVPVASLLAVLAGVLFGTWVGLGLMGVAAVVGCTLSLMLSRRFIRPIAENRFGDRVEALNRRQEKHGLFDLFALRMSPFIPTALINVLMGISSISLFQHAWVSLLGMLPALFILVRAGDAAGTVESPGVLLTPFHAVLLTVLGALPVLVRMSLGVPRRKIIICSSVAVGVVLVAFIGRAMIRYRAADSMTIAVQELSNSEYPEDPSSRSIHHGKYSGRTLNLIKRDETHFDFVFEPKHSHIARITIKNVDCSLLTPGIPEWMKDNSALKQIALQDRQFNRQQVRFGGVSSPYVEVTGGDGFERQLLYSAELVKNSLQAGKWEVMLYTNERNDKTLYYQGWFDFPLGHYKKLFEQNTGLSYWKNFPYLEHRLSAEGKTFKLDELRKVTREAEARSWYDPNERVFASGEQARRRRMTMGQNVLFWKDYAGERDVRFASFVEPGRYRADRLVGHKFNRIAQYDRALVRQIVSCADKEPRSELELVFTDPRSKKRCRLLISGFQWDLLPQVAIEQYPLGRYLPMGLAVPPVFQDYPELANSPPHKSPYFSMFLDDDGCWLDHHSMGIGGPILHRDIRSPNYVHVYLMSYERHALIGHWVIERT